MKNKKILYIPSWIDVDFKSPGQSTFTRFPEAIAGHGDTTVGMIYAEMHIQQFKRVYIETENAPYPYLGMRAWTPPKRGSMWNTWMKKYLELYEKYTEKHWVPDVIHSHGILGGIIADEIYKKHKIPFIHTEHLGKTEVDRLPGDYIKRFKSLAKNAKALTTVSSGNKKFLDEKIGAEFKLVPNFTDNEFFQAKTKATDQPVFISIGEPAYTKGLDNLLNSFVEIRKELPEAILILVDKIRDRKAVVDPIIKKQKLKRSVIMTGIVDKYEIRRLLQSAAIYISASRHESFGVTMVESLMCGTPVVATETDGSLDILEKSVGRLVEQKNKEQLTEAILEVYHDRKKYKPQNLHNYAAKRYGEGSVVQLWENLYRNV